MKWIYLVVTFFCCALLTSMFGLSTLYLHWYVIVRCICVEKIGLHFTYILNSSLLPNKLFLGNTVEGKNVLHSVATGRRKY